MSTRSRVANAAYSVTMGGPRIKPPQEEELRRAIGGRTVLVTGASAGIGRALALQCGRAGATVALVARREDALAELAEEIRADGGTATVHACDLSDLEALDAVAEEVLAAHERVDVLVNNAARSIRRRVTDSFDRFHDVERTVQLNYLAPVRLLHRVLPGMLEAGDGHIVNCLTLGVLATPPKFAAYLGSKAALDAYSRSVAAELVEEGIRVTSAYLPLVRTEMIAPTASYEGVPALTAEQAANMLASAMVDRPRRLAPPAGLLLDAARIVAPTSLLTTGRALQRRFSGSH